MIVGIDEVGRGCWAGPLVAGAVLLTDDFTVPEGKLWRLSDSKVLSKRQRQATAIGLDALGITTGLGWVSAQEIDNLGLTAAVSLAMRRALASVDAAGAVYDEIIIDGSFNFLPDVPKVKALVKADAVVPAVSAASIVAKVARDNWMATEAAMRFPGYGFERHVGYGTREHREALAMYGICDLHRRSFKPIRALL